MKPVSLLTVAFQSWVIAARTIPPLEQGAETTKPLDISREAEVREGFPDTHMDKRADWKDWAPSSTCIQCMTQCVKSNFEKNFVFTYKVSTLTISQAAAFTSCGVTCVLRGSCFSANRNEVDPFYRQSEAGRIMNQYREMNMIEGAGSSSPNNG